MEVFRQHPSPATWDELGPSARRVSAHAYEDHPSDVQANEHPPLFFVSYLWMQAIRERVINDPNWPPWSAEKK